MFKWIIETGKSMFQGPRNTSSRPPVQLVLESLEQRDLLTAYTWHFRTPTVGQWSSAHNWDDAPNHEASVYPGQNSQNDTATFDGTSIVDCTVDISPTISAITITSGYTGKVTINRSLTLTGAPNNPSSVASSMAGGTIAGGTLNIALNLNSPVPFSWTGGTFANGIQVNNDGGNDHFWRR